MKTNSQLHEEYLLELNNRVATVRDENTGIKVVTAVCGILHFGLSLAAEAVSCAEASAVSKMSKGTVSYAQMKEYRSIVTAGKIDGTKTRVRDFETKMRNLKAKAEAKRNATEPTVQPLAIVS